MSDIDLNAKMHNEATVSDWLGTAATAAQCAAAKLESIRRGLHVNDTERLSSARTELIQALDEVEVLQAAIEQDKFF